MSALLKFAMFLFAAVVLPVLTGLLPASLLPAIKRKLPLVVLSGYLATFVLFEAVGIPILIWTPMGDFSLLVRVFLAVDGLWILAGIVAVRRRGGVRFPKVREWRNDPDAAFWWLIFLVLVAVQLYWAYTRASYDGDDAYYVAQSLQTWQTGTMYYYVPYTGVTTSLDGRHALALMPMWIAFVARLCGTHSTIVTHSMLPLVLIPLVDVTYYQLFRELSRGKKRVQRRQFLPAAMTCLAVLQIFGNTSIYTAETFLLMRTWQGKAMFVNFILPMLFVLLFRRLRFDEDENRWYWLMLVMLTGGAGFFTSLAPAMVSGGLLLGTILIRIFKKRKGLLQRTVLCCIPAVVYLVFLLRMVYPSLVPFLKGGRLP